MRSFRLYLFGTLFAFLACKEQYKPKVASFESNILVIDGYINTGGDSTIVRLSRTVSLNNQKTANPEAGATISVETSTNESKALIEKEKGLYVTPALTFGSNKKYRLRIKTKSGSTYLSDFVEAKLSPPIDSVNYAVKPDGIQVYVNTGDVNNKTHYYLWQYEETWIFYAKFYSTHIWHGGTKAVARTAEESAYQCWGNGNSSSIVIGSSVKLSKDVMHLSPLTFIPSNSEKLSEKYSILVKQYALTKEAFEFWQSLKKNTESLGSIFDVLPSQLTGNIHNVANKDEPVIGYISAGDFQKHRIFISKDKWPDWKPLYPFDCGTPDTVLLKDERNVFPVGASIPLIELYNEIGEVIGHTAISPRCGDCKVRGTNKKPIFWQ